MGRARCYVAAECGFWPLNDRDGGISHHLSRECRNVEKVHVVRQRELLSHQPPQRPAVLVLRPAISADETQASTRSQQAQTPLKEWDIKISAIEERGVACPISGE